MIVIERAVRFLKRHAAARRIGVSFGRTRSFRLPSTICLNGRKTALDMPDERGQLTAFIELFLDDCYCLREIAKDNHIATVLDIGANVGLFGLAARRAFPNSRVHSYEPNPALIKRLSSHARQADIDYFTEAVGREAGMVSLILESGQSVLSSTRSDPNGSIPQVAFQTALDRLGGHVDVVKLDCEGAEWEILEDRESWSRVRFVTMEYHLGTGDGHSKIENALRGIGFQIRNQIPLSGFGLVLAERQ